MNICDNLPLYVYGEMDTHEKQEFEKHLAVCEYCRKLKETFNEVRYAKVLHSAPLNVINAVFEKTSRRTPLFRISMRMRKLGFAAAIFLLVGVGYITTGIYKNMEYSKYDGSSTMINEMMKIDSDMDEYESLFII